jgi:lycopene cyclase domain-containing protein
MNTYVLVNIGIVIFPFLLSFDRRVAFYRRWPAVFPAITLTAAVYLLWDVLAAARGDWSFNPRYAGDFTLLGLPPGEILFFFTVPYACLFVYEVLRGYFREKTAAVPRPLFFALAVLFAGAGLLFLNRDYSVLALFSVALFFAGAGFFYPSLFSSSYTWWYFFVTYLLFILCNAVLTALPIVEYGPQAIWGIRVYTIPLEDFFYNFSLLGFNLLAYKFFLREGPAGASRTGP